jgi:hypothetical protein
MQLYFDVKNSVLHSAQYIVNAMLGAIDDQSYSLHRREHFGIDGSHGHFEVSQQKFKPPR